MKNMTIEFLAVKKPSFEGFLAKMTAYLASS
jgi:hypothetical protein